MCVRGNTREEFGQQMRRTTPPAVGSRNDSAAVAIYLRVSTEEQRERQSIETQREFGDRYCALHELSVYRVFADDGVSGTVPLDKRPIGSQILEDAKQHKFDQLLVYRLDRLGRDTRLILNAVADLEKFGVRVRSMTEEFDTGTPTGRLMLTMLSGFASHERDVIRERSVAGTNRVAESGAWLGGIVPFGYRKTGEKRNAHVVVSEEVIPGVEMSEADVIREVFRMATVEKKSCRVIATRLNDLHIPCAYVRDDRVISSGKRKQRTSGVWSPGRIRALLTNKMYFGVHEYGKRAVRERTLIPRAMPAIVSEDTWRKAQTTLQGNCLFSARSARTKYLLRGLIKCGLCGKTYIGMSSARKSGKREYYYRCNGAHSPSIYLKDRRCVSKGIQGDVLEQQVWADVETFLRNPGPVLDRLRTRLEMNADGSEHAQRQLARFEELLARTGTERNMVVGLYRRGRLSEADLDHQLEEIRKEESGLQNQIEELQTSLARSASVAETVDSAQGLLEMLRHRLGEEVTWEQKRRLIEVLVANVRVDTSEQYGIKHCTITVTYRFAQPGEPMPTVLPQDYSPGRVSPIPTELRTVGDHIRMRRLTLRMFQRDVAKQFGVDNASIVNWELNTSNPGVQYMPAIIEFLGYNPLPEAKGLDGQLVRHRTSLGLTQKQAAARIGVDAGTLARWERGEREPTGRHLALVERFLCDAERNDADSTTSPRLAQGGRLAPEVFDT